MTIPFCFASRSPFQMGSAGRGAPSSRSSIPSGSGPPPLLLSPTTERPLPTGAHEHVRLPHIPCGHRRHQVVDQRVFAFFVSAFFSFIFACTQGKALDCIFCRAYVAILAQVASAAWAKVRARVRSAGDGVRAGLGQPATFTRGGAPLRPQIR